MNIRFGTWAVKSLYRVIFLMIVEKDVSEYKLDLLRVQEVRWNRGGTEPAGEYTFFFGKGNDNSEIRRSFNSDIACWHSVQNVFVFSSAV
jgi:hypothetical protein